MDHLRRRKSWILFNRIRYFQKVGKRLEALGFLIYVTTTLMLYAVVLRNDLFCHCHPLSRFPLTTSDQALMIKSLSRFGNSAISTISVSHVHSSNVPSENLLFFRKRQPWFIFVAVVVVVFVAFFFVVADVMINDGNVLLLPLTI